MFGAEAFPRITTGTDLVPASSRILTTTGGGSAVESMSPMDSIREMFIDMRDSLQQIAENTLKTNDLLQTAVLGTPAQQRDEAIEKGETDTDIPKPEEDTGPGFFQRLTDRVTGVGTFGKFLLTIAALTALKLFGDKLIPGLAKLIEIIKKGEITKNLEDVIINIKDNGVEKFEELKEGMEKFIAGVKTVVGIVTDLYTRLEDFTEGFDMEATMEKLKPIMEDIKKRTIEAIGNFAKEALLAIGGAIIGATFLKQTLSMALANPALKTIFSGKVLSNAAATKAALRAGTLVPIAGLLLYGITTTYSNITSSIAKTIEEEGSFKFGPFLANFFGGKGEGGWFNALKQAFKVGGTFALSGLAIGFAVTSFTGPGALVGALVGGLIGTAVGAVIGAFTGYLGSDKLKEFGSALKGTIDSAIDYVKSFFQNLINDVKRLLGFQTDPSLDLSKAEQDVIDAKAKLATNPNYMPFIKDLERAEKALEEELAKQPLKQAEAATGFTMQGLDASIQQETDTISMLQSQKSLITPATDFKDPVSGLTKSQEIDKAIQEAQYRLQVLEGNKIMLEQSAGQVIPGMTLGESEIQNRIKQQETSMMGAGSIGSGGTVTKIDNSNTAIKGGDNIITSGLSSENTDLTSLLLASKKARMA